MFLPRSLQPIRRKTIRRRETTVLQMGYILSSNRKEAAVLGKLQSFNFPSSRSLPIRRGGRRLCASEFKSTSLIK